VNTEHVVSKRNSEGLQVRDYRSVPAVPLLDQPLTTKLSFLA